MGRGRKPALPICIYSQNSFFLSDFSFADLLQSFYKISVYINIIIHDNKRIRINLMNQFSEFSHLVLAYDCHINICICFVITSGYFLAKYIPRISVPPAEPPFLKVRPLPNPAIIPPRIHAVNGSSIIGPDGTGVNCITTDKKAEIIIDLIVNALPIYRMQE